MPQTRWHQMKTIGGLDPFFFLFFPSAAVAVYCSLCDPPPLLPPSTFCGSRNASMFPTELPQRTVPDVSETSPGLCWCKVGENGGGGLLFLEDQDSQISQPQSYSMSFCLYQDSGAPVYLLSCVFNPGAP